MPDEQTRLKAAVDVRHPERWALILLALNTGAPAGEIAQPAMERSGSHGNHLASH